jgi:hypothetical protein
MPFRERPLVPASVSGRDFVVRTGELDRMGEAVQRATALGGEVVQTGSGVVAPGPQDPFLWVKITAADGSTPPQYSWTQVFPDAAGGFQDLGDAASGSPGNLPAFEQNGVVLTSFPVYVRLYLGATWCYFSVPSSSSALTVSTINPSGTVSTAVTNLEIDEGDGLLATGITPSKVKISIQSASNSNPGVVDLHAGQVLGAGDKVFQECTVTVKAMGFMGTKGNLAIDNVAYGLVTTSDVGLTVTDTLYRTTYCAYQTTFSGTTYSSLGIVDPGFGSGITTTRYALLLAGKLSTSGAATEKVGGLVVTQDGVTAVSMNSDGSFNNSYFSVMGVSGGPITGLNATINYTKSGGGTGTLTFTGGILTNST